MGDAFHMGAAVAVARRRARVRGGARGRGGEGGDVRELRLRRLRRVREEAEARDRVAAKGALMRAVRAAARAWRLRAAAVAVQHQGRGEDGEGLARRGAVEGRRQVHRVVRPQGAELRGRPCGRIREVGARVRVPRIPQTVARAVARGEPRGHAAGHGAGVLARGPPAGRRERVRGVGPGEGRPVAAPGPDPCVLQQMATDVREDERRRGAQERERSVAPRAGHDALARAPGRGVEEHVAHHAHQRAREHKADPVPKRSGGSGHRAAHQADHEGGPASCADEGRDGEEEGGHGEHEGPALARVRRRRRLGGRAVRSTVLAVQEPLAEGVEALGLLARDGALRGPTGGGPPQGRVSDAVGAAVSVVGHHCRPPAGWAGGRSASPACAGGRQ
mmetsp:Transcript_2823/g.9234  ORF Transcript_2823/g.9234 Transcript_2823/m.9234 type:complete len:390 (+) Transcript_2823:591-1760(+)